MSAITEQECKTGVVEEVEMHLRFAAFISRHGQLLERFDYTAIREARKRETGEPYPKVDRPYVSIRATWGKRVELVVYGPDSDEDQGEAIRQTMRALMRGLGGGKWAKSYNSYQFMCEPIEAAKDEYGNTKPRLIDGMSVVIETSRDKVCVPYEVTEPVEVPATEATEAVPAQPAREAHTEMRPVTKYRCPGLLR